VTRDGIPNEFPPLQELIASFRNLGIAETARIVLYGDDPGLYAARTWAALDVIGLAGRAALLDGGLAAWRAAGQPVDTGAAPGVSPRPLQAVQPDEPRVVDAEWVRSHLGDSTVLFVDARPPANYEGREDCPAERAGCLPEGRRGHIPGAVSLSWMQALTDGEVRRTRSLHQLHHELWRPAGADRPGIRTIVVYCSSGMQASHGYWQARYIGYADVRLYDGSMSEWSGLPASTHPVVAGR
jgi:thiosulfate/3-mercaptopyruvate sulfurtransferase